MFIIYDIIFILYAICYLPYLVLTGRCHPEFHHRFGFFPADLCQLLRQKPNIWVHAVSVGEVMATEGLIALLREQYPAYQVVVTVTTKTGFELAQARLANKAIVIPAPLDMSLIVHYFIRTIKPRLYLIAETEIWPNVLMALESAKVPSMIINGRISDTSFKRYQMITAWLTPVLRTIDLMAVQSQLDATRLIAMGALPARVKVLGNIKFDEALKSGQGQIEEYAFAQDALILLGGSTHPGEEEILIEAYQALLKTDNRWRLVLAPRHIERTGDIVDLVRLKDLQVIKFSAIKQELLNQQEVLIVDTIGQLRHLYAFATIVFVGKSLCVGGGHNIIEPALYNKPIIVGHRMENFRDIMRCFKDGQGIIEVQSAQAFIDQVITLAGDEQGRLRLGSNARAVVEHHQGATSRTLKEIKTLL